LDSTGKKLWNSNDIPITYKKDELNQLLKENGFEIIELSNSNDEGTNWIEVFAKKI